MGLFDVFKGNSVPSDPAEAREKLAGLLLGSITVENRIRAEDAISLAATVVAERCIDADGAFSLREHDMPPGSYVFSDGVNELIFGKSGTSVYEMLLKQLTADGYVQAQFPEQEKILKDFASKIGAGEEWGFVPLSVPKENKPGIPPLRAGFETRKAVDTLLSGMAGKRISLNISILVLCDIMRKIKGVIDPSVALLLALETVNGMSKTAPMTEKAMREAKKIM